VKTAGANQNNTAGISKARVNVIRTMLFISVCFVVCLMPYDTYFFVRVVTVFIHLFTLFFILPIATLQYNVIASDDPKVAASRRPDFIFVGMVKKLISQILNEQKLTITHTQTCCSSVHGAISFNLRVGFKSYPDLNSVLLR